jgi:phosphoribosylamine-glycine ligase
VVIKADGLAGGKGVIMPTTKEEAQKALKIGALVAIEDALVVLGWRKRANSITVTESEDTQLIVVIKADGLAGGKGVIMPTTKEEAQKALKEMMLDQPIPPVLGPWSPSKMRLWSWAGGSERIV